MPVGHGKRGHVDDDSCNRGRVFDPAQDFPMQINKSDTPEETTTQLRNDLYRLILCMLPA